MSITAIRNHPALPDAVDAVLAELREDARQSFEHMDDLVDHDIRTRGFVTARLVA